MYDNIQELVAGANRAKDLEEAARSLRAAFITRETALQTGSDKEKETSLKRLIEAKDNWKRTLSSVWINETEYEEAKRARFGRKSRILLDKAMSIFKSLY